jgi:hypothetical protein
MRNADSDSRGEVVWTDLPMGNNRFTIAVPGFRLGNITVTVHGSTEKKVVTTLEIGSVGGMALIQLSLPGVKG